MKKIILFLFAALAVLLAATPAIAAYTYATDVTWVEGDDTYDDDRRIPANALGEPDGKFLSLGQEGWAVFSFGTLFSGEATFHEITNGDRSGWKEYLNVWVGNSVPDFDDDPTEGFTDAGLIDNQSVPSILSLPAGQFSFLLVQDRTLLNNGHPGDGFDIDAVGVNPVPIPAAIWLLGSGIVGLIGFRRFSK